MYQEPLQKTNESGNSKPQVGEPEPQETIGQPESQVGEGSIEPIVQETTGQPESQETTGQPEAPETTAETPPIIPLSNEPKECKYKNQIIELKTESLDTEIKISQIIKILDTKYEPNFSYIIKTEPININEITEKDEIITCNLSTDLISEYILCEYVNRPDKTIIKYLEHRKNQYDSKIIIRMVLDFHSTLQEALIDLYKETNIIHNSINENNILISEEDIPIIKNFREAKQDEKLSNFIDIHSLAKSFLNIINTLSITDETINKYKESLEKIVNSEPSEKSLFIPHNI